MPEAVEEYLRSQKSNKIKEKKPQVSFSQPKKRLAVEYPRKLEILRTDFLLKSKSIINFVGWFLLGLVVLISLPIKSVLEIILLIITIGFLWLVRWLINSCLDYLIKIVERDWANSEEKYWQAISHANKLLAKEDRAEVRRKIVKQNDLKRDRYLSEKKKSENEEKVETEGLSLGFNLQVQRGEAKSSAQKGVSEAYLEKYLRQYFPSCQIVEDYLPIPNSKFGYSTDFSIISLEGVAIDLEIDEPYEGKSKQPHHCCDDDKDYNRNQFFAERDWIVLRVSEFQVVHQPVSICALIGKILTKVTGNLEYSKQFVGVESLVKDNTWTKSEAVKLSKGKYREKYLQKAGIFKNR